ncbi:MAG: STAS domain-containing protein [Planctomycetes bacterium]|nr:STAS domain-containing protein [Planctomycetota bacterium]
MTEITHRQDGPRIELGVSGRLDGYGADLLGRELEAAIRGGARHLRLDLSATNYISSVALGLLVRTLKQLHALDGTFAVVRPAAEVAAVLQVTHLAPLLVETAEAAEALQVSTVVWRGRGRDAEAARAGVATEVRPLAVGGAMSYSPLGDPRFLEGGGPAAATCRAVPFPESVVGVGLGAFGADGADCRGRFGEFLAAGGCAACLPTDGRNVVDYVLRTGDLVPTVQVLSGLACSGTWSHLARFEPAGEPGCAPLSLLAEGVLEVAAADTAALVMIAETAGLVGATLRASPDLTPPASAFFAHPEIQKRLSFAPERVHARSLALVVGVITRNAPSALAPRVRPLKAGVHGHLHAVTFPFRPLRKKESDLVATVRSLFESGGHLGVLHLLNDDRPIDGAGESVFVRGSCWLAPVKPM